MIVLAVALGASPDLNTATLDQLDALPGLGRAKATAILDHRAAYGPFRSMDDLLAVPGIGLPTVRVLRKWATVRADAVVPVVPPAPRAAEARIPLVPTVRLLDPNTASTAQLASWPGITGDRAEAIAEVRRERPFRSCAELARVPGVGPATVAVIGPMCAIPVR